MLIKKLRLNDVKYRVLSAKLIRIKARLLRCDGVKMFFNQLGFDCADNDDAQLTSPIDQPTFSVLDSAEHVCSDYRAKAARGRAVINNLKPPSPSRWTTRSSGQQARHGGARQRRGL